MQSCAICRSSQNPLVHNFKGRQNQPLLEILEERIPNWNRASDAVCTACLDGIHQELLSDLLNVNLMLGNLSLLWANSSVLIFASLQNSSLEHVK